MVMIITRNSDSCRMALLNLIAFLMEFAGIPNIVLILALLMCWVNACIPCSKNIDVKVCC